MKKITQIIFVFILLFATYSCSILKDTEPTKYQEYVYNNTLFIQNQATALIKESTHAFKAHTNQVNQLKRDITIHYQFLKTNKYNHQLKIWDLIQDPNQNLLISYLDVWQKNDSISPALQNEFLLINNAYFNHLLSIEKFKNE